MECTERDCVLLICVSRANLPSGFDWSVGLRKHSEKPSGWQSWRWNHFIHANKGNARRPFCTWSIFKWLKLQCAFLHLMSSRSHTDAGESPCLSEAMHISGYYGDRYRTSECKSVTSNQDKIYMSMRAHACALKLPGIIYETFVLCL